MAPAPKMICTKTPGVFKRGARYVVVFRDADGRQRKEAVRTYDLARALKIERESEVARGAYVPAGKLTFHEFAREWIDSYTGKKQGIRPGQNPITRAILRLMRLDISTLASV